MLRLLRRIRRLFNFIPFVGYRHPFYFFHHIPKTGGTAVMTVLSEWFLLLSDYRENKDSSDKPRIELTLLGKLHCIVGHFGDQTYFLDVRYPEVFKGLLAKYKFRCFTFIREPLSMRCSLYRHQNQNTNQAQGQTLFEHLCHKDNYSAAILHVDESNYKQRLDKYFFVGTTDDLQLSFDLLAKQIKKPRLELPVVNTTSMKHSMLESDLSDEQVAEFKRRNKLDYLIYDYAKQRMAALQ